MVIHFVGAVLGTGADYKPLDLVSESIECDLEGSALDIFVEDRMDDFVAELAICPGRHIAMASYERSMEELSEYFEEYYEEKESARIKAFKEKNPSGNRFATAYSGREWQPYAAV